MKTIPFLITIPHSGEKVPDFVDWLKNLPEPVLMCDVDRYVDRLYQGVLDFKKIPFVKTEWHRYAVDLNRIPEDVDASSLEGSQIPAGKNSRGYHWVITTKNDSLMKKPVSMSLHQQLTDLIYKPFHESVQKKYQEFRQQGHQKIYHLDAHSMPSLGTAQHRDPGERRADIVVSDCDGKSCDENYVDLVVSSYVRAGFKVAYNWPYVGGRVTEVYGKPSAGQQAIQVELNRSLYMDEDTKKIKSADAEKVAKKIQSAVGRIYDTLSRTGL